MIYRKQKKKKQTRKLETQVLIFSSDIMKIPKLLPRKLTKPQSENNDDEDDQDLEKAEGTESQEPAETQSENQQETVQKRADNQAILRLVGEGEKVYTPL